MNLDVWDSESNASEVYDLAKCDVDDVPSMARLARGLLGPRAIQPVSGCHLLGDAKLAKVNGEYRIYVRRALPVKRLVFALAHEVSEWFYRDSIDENIERACNQLAGALVAPRRAFLGALRSVGENFRELGAAFISSETSMALRLGETTDQPIVALTKTHHFVRGREWNWPAEPELRRIARSGRPGIRRVKLTDDRRRTVLLAEDAIDAA